MRLLLIHGSPLEEPGGAEISLREHLAVAPSHIKVDVALPETDISLEKYDTVILANLRPPGGVGELGECKWAKLWIKRLKGYNGYVIKSERDMHPCAHRNGNCIQTQPLKRIPCNCGPLIPNTFETLYNLCDTVQFLSPLHRQAINCLIRMDGPRQYEVGCPIDLNRFYSTTPFHQRKNMALLIGDANRVAPDAVALAETEGYSVEYVDHLSVPYNDMPHLYNQYKAVVIAPVMLHAFGRMVVEALSCGCHVITNDRVGALSWPDPILASQRANEMFWAMVADRPAKPNPLRVV